MPVTFRSQLALFLLLATSCLPSTAQITATAKCLPEYSWAQNDQGKDPCYVAAAAQAALGTNTWEIRPLEKSTNLYDIPNSGKGPPYANAATCSWAVYNLMAACAACQGFETSFRNWRGYTQNCTDTYLLETYFPPNTPLVDGTTIPVWAGTNPATWNDGRFDIDKAKSIAAQNRQDLQPSGDAVAPKSKAPIGAIVGGVVGGVAVLVVGAILAWYLLRRRRTHGQLSRSTDGRGGLLVPTARPIHGRSFSDLSQKTNTQDMHMNVQSYISHGHGGNAPTIYTHHSSQASLTHFGSVAQPSIYSGHTSSGQVPSPPPVAHHSVVLSREEIIVPFMVSQNQVSPVPSQTHRKGGSDVSDAANSIIPVSRADDSQSSDIHINNNPSTPPSRRRVNPPAYTPSITGSQSPGSSSSQIVAATRRETIGHGHRAIRHKTSGGRLAHGSQDTTMSWDSSPGGSREHRGLATIQGSISGMDEIIARSPNTDQRHVPIA